MHPAGGIGRACYLRAMTGPWTLFASAIANDHVLASLLVSGPLRNAAQEARMTVLRRRCLMAGAAPPELLAHLAIQCFLNEYAWAETPEETARVAALAGRRDPVGLLLLAAYRPLSDLPDLPEGPALPDAVRAVLRVQVADVALERRLAAEIPTLTPIRSGVSEAVQAQYEENPYPRWASVDRVEPTEEASEILIAGCGTGRGALGQARRKPKSRVLAVDLSRASLAYGMRMAGVLGVTNLTFAQADLLELGGLGRTFDVIECSGVLHHLADPFAGARVLASLLRPGGRIGIGVYSRKARAYLAPAKALAAGFPPTPEGVRALRRAILHAPEGDPVREVLQASDFFSVSACRDLLMHVQEQVLDLPDLHRMLGENGLEVEAVMLPPPILELYKREFPGAPLTDLGQWAEFEDRHPATFRGMYQVWARKRA